VPAWFLANIRAHRTPIVLVALLLIVAAAVAMPDAAAADDHAVPRTLLLVAALAAAAFAIAWVGSRRAIVRRLRTLTAAARRLGAGELDARTGLAYAADDIGELARALDAMAEGIAARERTLAEAADELRRANRALRALSVSNRTLLEAVDERALLEQACRNAVEIGGYRLAWVGYAAEDDDKTVQPVARAGADEGYLDAIKVSWGDNEFGQGVVGTAIRTGAPCISNNLLAEPRLAPWREEAEKRGYKSVVAMPLAIAGHTIGAIAIYSNEPDAFQGPEVDLLREMADDLAFGIRTIRLRVEQRTSEAIIRSLAYHDPLTGLPNRARFLELIGAEIEDARAHGAAFAVLSLGFANFREVSDTLGYQIGIEVLRRVAPRVHPVLGSQDILALTHGNDFGILLPRVDARAAVSAAQAVYGLFQDSVRLEGVTVDMRMAVGVTLFPDHGEHADDLVRRADVAMRTAIRRKAAFVVYDPELDRRAPEQLRLAVELRHAIETGQLLLYAQPKADARTAAIVGAEALVRWRDPNRGMIPPDEFIPVAERIGLIRPLTRWVIETALRQCYAWRGADFPLPIAVNLSSRNLIDGELVDEIDALVTTWRIPPVQVGFEITETALMEDPAKALTTLTQLHERGFHLAIDDFGIGYSSLGYLQRLPVDAIKIDKSFVGRMIEDADSAAIVRSTIELAHSLGKQVVAEGVETQTLWDRLRDLECDVVQGYFLSRPMPIAELKPWLAASPWTLARNG
jgi:diguanylate cyclase (GGDEF)-like protein